MTFKYNTNTMQVDAEATPAAETKLSPDVELACQAIYQGLVFFANTSAEFREDMDTWLCDKLDEAKGRLHTVLDELTDGTHHVIENEGDYED